PTLTPIDVKSAECWPARNQCRRSPAGQRHRVRSAVNLRACRSSPGIQGKATGRLQEPGPLMRFACVRCLRKRHRTRPPTAWKQVVGHATVRRLRAFREDGEEEDCYGKKL